MRLNELNQQVCPVARSLHVVGDGWTLMIVRELFLGSRRFEDLRVQTGMSPQLLSRRLNELTETGILRRHAYQERPPRFEFRLTKRGLDLWPVVIALKQWGDTWATDEFRSSLVTLTHHGCGRRIEPVLACPDCGESVDARSVGARMARPMVEDRQARKARNRQSSRRAVRR